MHDWVIGKKYPTKTGLHYEYIGRCNELEMPLIFETDYGHRTFRYTDGKVVEGQYSLSDVMYYAPEVKKDYVVFSAYHNVFFTANSFKGRNTVHGNPSRNLTLHLSEASLMTRDEAIYLAQGSDFRVAIRIDDVKDSKFGYEF